MQRQDQWYTECSVQPGETLHRSIWDWWCLSNVGDVTQWTLSKRVHRILKWGECSYTRGCWGGSTGLTGISSSSTKTTLSLHLGWTISGPQYSLGPTLQNSSAERDPEVGSKVLTSQQHAVVAKVANSSLPSISRIVTSRDSKVNLPLHLDIPGVLCPVLVFLLQYKPIWKPRHNIQFHH